MKPTALALGIVLALAPPLVTRAAAQGGVERIAFDWCFYDYYDFGGLVCDVVTVNPDGSEPTFLTEGAAPAFSHDGTKLAFALSGTYSMRSAEVSTLDLATGTVADLTAPYFWAFYPDQAPAWSPDGSKIAFGSSRDGALDLYVMNADGSGAARVTHGVGFQGHPAWSHDGARIAFDCTIEAHNYDICTIAANGTDLVRLTTKPGYDGGAAYSPDGNRIAFATASPGSWSSQIALMNVDGTSVTLTGVSGVNPAWSPSGAQFAFEWWSPLCDSDNYCNGSVGVANADGSNVYYVSGGQHPTWTTSPLPRLLAAPIASFVPYQCDVRTMCADTYSSWDDQAGPWPDSGIVEYRWEFGDGTTGTGPDPHHRYAANGTYTIALTVTDSDGLKTTQRQSLTLSQW